ncbi:Mn-containing catalase [Arthrobacter sp. V4I6]|nr:Mn-containing catalase [Arthrobacter sp. V1I7]MDQ0854012.1 Mn-containing catalase [Arthrobacter sp. V4I6]
MYLHTQLLVNEIAVDEPDPAAANASRKVWAFGEMRTTMQYLFQCINFPGDPASKPYKDLLEGIGTEEISRSTIAYLIVRDQAHENAFAKALPGRLAVEPWGSVASRGTQRP